MNRRQFLQKSILAGSLTIVSPLILTRKAETRWAQRTAVHPRVDPLRVVGITDSRMTRDHEPVSSWIRQDELVGKEAVWENIDRLACALTKTRNYEDAWRGIFVKPPKKSWSETVVAIKTNNIFKQHTRSAVMSRICNALTEIVGIKGSNIHIYDGSHGRNLNQNTPFSGLPRGCKIENTWGGFSRKTAVSQPWKGGSSPCVEHFVNGAVDILINIALCKGHWVEFGGFTMTMKNHFGTFHPGPGHENDGLDYLIAINQTPEILGAIDKQTGRVLYPRQQLCIVDALWASKGGPEGLPSAQPNFLAMGVFSPVVDYVVATRFRQERMGWPVNMENARRYLTDFGYEESDLPFGGKLIEI